MADNKQTISIELSGVLGITFLCLKLAGVIDWSWWIVLLPFYFPLVVIATLMIFLVILGVGGFIVLQTIEFFERRKRNLARR